jgi:hypothetical protein
MIKCFGVIVVKEAEILGALYISQKGAKACAITHPGNATSDLSPWRHLFLELATFILGPVRHQFTPGATLFSGKSV